MAKNIKQQFEIMGHELVPHHEILSDQEKEKVMKDFNTAPDQLPKIIDNDPVALSIGAKPGQIIKIIRKSHTAKESIAYRFVVESGK
jgi:DNA-directed RNA polymerase subunit H